MNKVLGNSKQSRFFAVRKIRGDNGGSAGRIDIYGSIDSDRCDGNEMTPAKMLSELEALGSIGQIDVHIFSNGGDVFAGLAIYSILIQRSEPINVYIEGIAASIATVISCAGDNVYIADSAVMMVHNPYASFFLESLNADGARELAAELEKARVPMIHAYVRKTGRTEAEIKSALDGKKGNGTWFTAAEAIEFGLADGYIPESKQSAELVARLTPTVLGYKGHRVDLSKLPNAGRITANINNPKKSAKKSEGVTSKMPKMSIKLKNLFKTKKRSKRRNRAEAELIEMVCPHCNADVLLNPETAEAALVPATEEGEAILEVIEEETTQARRMRNNLRAELYTVICPSCGEEFVWDTEETSPGDEGEPVLETDDVPLEELLPEDVLTAEEDEEITPEEEEEIVARLRARLRARRKSASKRRAGIPGRKAKARRIRRTRAEIAEAICPECSALVPYDTVDAEVVTDENGVEGYSLICGECGTAFLVPMEEIVPGEETIPEAIPVDTPPATAYRMGVRAERQRMLALDEMGQAAPGLDKMIQKAKRSGASAQTMSRNVFKAMSGNPKVRGANQLGAILRDAQNSGVNDMMNPKHYNRQASFYETVNKRLEDR